MCSVSILFQNHLKHIYFLSSYLEAVLRDQEYFMLEKLGKSFLSVQIEAKAVLDPAKTTAKRLCQKLSAGIQLTIQKLV